MNRRHEQKIFLPPHNTEAEQAILGGILLNNEILNDLVATLKPKDFYREAHSQIYSGMISLYDRGIEIDLITLCDILKKHDQLQRVGGSEYLASLADVISTSAGYNYHAELVRDAAVRRKLMITCQEIHQGCSHAWEETRQLLDQAEQSIFDLAENRIKEGLQSVGGIVEESYSLLKRAKAGEMSGFETGFVDIDRMTGGLQPKELIILAARPGMGKTALALNIAHNLAYRGKGVAIFSLEMSKEQLVLRLMASIGRVDSFKMRVGRLGREDFDALTKAAGTIAKLPIFIDDTPDVNLLEMKAKIRRMERQQTIGLIIVDYLQLIRPLKSENSREKEVADICGGLKSIAKSFGFPVLAISQLNRRVEGRDVKRPELADLRESGSIEQDADTIMFIYRPEVYERKPDHRGKAEIILAKQRNGPTDTIKLTYLHKYTRFENYSA